MTKLELPTYEELMLPCLRQHLDGEKTVPQMIPALARELSLSQQQVDQMLASGRQTTLSNRLHWARIYMTRAGLLDRIRRGTYSLTDRGRNVLSANPTSLSNDDLKQFPEFLAFLNKSSSKDSKDDSTDSTDISGSDGTPIELIASAIEQIDDALATELLEAILELTPTGFEQLIVDLLTAMGYGGGDPARGQRLGQSGDGGIDGIVNEDALGLDAVYIQAKRYAPENTVGRPAIQAFVGSLTGEGATKGVFVTTSGYSKEARAYVDRIPQRVILIDGAALTRLMIRYEVGARVEVVHRIRKLDPDYFETT